MFYILRILANFWIHTNFIITLFKLLFRFAIYKPVLVFTSCLTLSAFLSSFFSIVQPCLFALEEMEATKGKASLFPETKL